jgi:SAM-dependent methyltransferase
MTTPSWDWAYAEGNQAPWDIGRPQPAFVELAAGGLLAGRVLDAGCGTGEHTLLAASHGADAMGIDVSPVAIERALEKAAARGIKARFEVGDALSLADLGLTFDTIIDSGLFHVFDDVDRARYVESLASVLRPGGTCYLMCFSDRQPGNIGPRRVSEDELRAAFGDGWTVRSVVADTFYLVPGADAIFGTATAQAWRAIIERGQGLGQARDLPGLRALPAGHMPSRPNSATRAGTRSERTAIASMTTPRAMAMASCLNCSSGITASAAKLAARATPAVVIAREAWGAATATASRTGLTLASSQIRPTTKTL